jgi:hypothetical protein
MLATTDTLLIMATLRLTDLETEFRNLKAGRHGK